MRKCEKCGREFGADVPVVCDEAVCPLQGEPAADPTLITTKASDGELKAAAEAAAREIER